MTVQELIDELQRVPNKRVPVLIQHDDGDGRDGRDVCRLSVDIVRFEGANALVRTSR